MKIAKPWARSALTRASACALTLYVLSSIVASQGQSDQFATVMINGREAVRGEVLLRYRDGHSPQDRLRVEAETGAEQVEMVGRRGLRRMQSRRLTTAQLLQQLQADPDVEFAEPNYVIRVARVPNDPSFGNLWGLLNTGGTFSGSVGIPGADISATDAWDITTGSRANVVGVVDTGIDYTHPDLAANIWSAPSAFSVTIGGVTITCAAGTHGFNAITNTCNPMDDHYHGTHVAGTIGAVGNNGVGVAGVSWVASMMGLKFLSSSGSGTTANAIKAIEFAIQAKAAFAGTSGANVRILSNSWGGGGFSQALLNEINAANTAEMLFVAAAGNSAVNTDTSPNYPSNYAAANVLSVAATNNRDALASFSNYGATTVDLGAPGVSTLSTYPGNQYVYLSGTSMATPHVSGAAALVLAQCQLSTSELKQVLLESVDPVAALSGITVTGGRLNAVAALSRCLPASLTSPVNGATLDGSTQTFTWESAPGATEYHLYVGSSAGGYDLHDASAGTNLSVTVAGLPTDGRTLYVRLWTKTGGSFQSRGYVFTAANRARAPAELQSPSADSYLSGPSATFTWTAGTGATSYHLYVGSTPGGYDLYDGAQGLAQSRIVNGLPTDGRELFITLWSRIDGAMQTRSSRIYALDGRATMSTPQPSSALGGASATFNWTAGTGVTEYYLYLGSSLGAYDLYEGSQADRLSATITGLPTDGRTIYVRLWSKIFGTFRARDYSYTAATTSPGTMQSPAPGATLSGASTTFTWSAGSGVAEYYLYVGSTPYGYDLYEGTQGTNQSKTVTGLPTDGRTIYVTLWSRIGGHFVSRLASYTAN